MKKEYDFSKAKRGVFRQLPPEEERARHTKVRISIFLDQDILKFFKSRAMKPGAEPYQTQINRALREYASASRPALKDSLLKDEDFITRVSERVAEYSTQSKAGSSKVGVELTDSSRHNNLVFEAWRYARSAASSDGFKNAFAKEGKDRDEWREPFQLLVACLIYSANGFKERAGRGFHDEIWRIPAAYPELFKTERPPFFESDPRLGEMFGNMHFASVSFRLRTAAFLVHRDVLKGKSPFAGLEKKIKGDMVDWNGPKLDKLRRNVLSIYCCQKKPLEKVGQGDKLLRICLAMIDPHRHAFGHGQIGDKRHEQRSKDYETFVRCQVAEAQLRLIRWGLSKLAEEAGVGVTNLTSLNDSAQATRPMVRLRGS